MKAQPTTKALIEMLYERLPEIFHRPHRTWVGLTDDEINASSKGHITRNGFARAIEAKLKQNNGYAEEKNT